MAARKKYSVKRDLNRLLVAGQQRPQVSGSGLRSANDARRLGVAQVLRESSGIDFGSPSSRGRGGSAGGGGGTSFLGSLFGTLEKSLLFPWEKKLLDAALGSGGGRRGSGSSRAVVEDAERFSLCLGLKTAGCRLSGRRMGGPAMASCSGRTGFIRRRRKRLWRRCADRC